MKLWRSTRQALYLWIYSRRERLSTWRLFGNCPEPLVLGVVWVPMKVVCSLRVLMSGRLSNFDLGSETVLIIAVSKGHRFQIILIHGADLIQMVFNLLGGSLGSRVHLAPCFDGNFRTPPWSRPFLTLWCLSGFLALLVLGRQCIQLHRSARFIFGSGGGRLIFSILLGHRINRDWIVVFRHSVGIEGNLAIVFNGVLVGIQRQSLDRWSLVDWPHWVFGYRVHLWPLDLYVRRRRHRRVFRLWRVL